MGEKIVQVPPGTLEKLLREEKRKSGGNPANPSPIEGKPNEITIQKEIPTNAVGGVPPTRVDRRRFLVGGALGALIAIGLEINPIVDYLTPLPWSIKTILSAPFVADELPQGWKQVESYPMRPDLPHNATILGKFAYIGKFSRTEVSSATIILQIPGKEQDTILYGIPMISFIDFRSSQEAQTSSKQYQYPGSRSVSGIGDKAWVDFYNSPPDTMSQIFVVDDNMLITALVKGDEQTVLNLGKFSVKYLARIGVTSKKP